MERTSRNGPDLAMVRSAQAGDQHALDALIAASLPLIYNIVGRALNGHADVDDVVQETLIRVVRHIGDLQNPAAYRSWIVAIAIRQIRDREHYYRTHDTQNADLDVAQQMPDRGSDFAELTILRLGLTDQRREVTEATRWLADEDQSLLSLWWLEEVGELERSDLANAMDLSAPHAAVRVARMKDQMQSARSVVRALRAQPRCPDLGALTTDWDGRPNPLWRKRIARHVRECGICGERTAGLLPMERLLAGVALVPVPASLAPSILAPGSDAPSAAHAHTVGRAAGRVAGRTSRRGLRLLPSGAHAAVAAVAVVAVVATTIAIVRSNDHSTPVALTSPSAAAATIVPSPSTVSPTPSATPAATPSKAPVVPPVTPPANSTRKGVSVWTFTGVNKALTESGATWYYTWSTSHSGITTPAGVQFVPMIWGEKSVTASALSQAKANGPNLLGFNEPDLSSQANMSVSQTLDLWPKLEATGMTLGSPSVAANADKPDSWLDQFMSGAKSRDYRIDFITLHWYGGDFRTANAVAQLKSYITAVYNRYHKPIWLTEYALAQFGTGGFSALPSQSQEAAFVTASTKMLDSLPYLKRYAWFALPADDKKPSTGLYSSGPVANAAGKAFEAAD